jgi:hypothetical protein
VLDLTLRHIKVGILTLYFRLSTLSTGVLSREEREENRRVNFIRNRTDSHAGLSWQPALRQGLAGGIGIKEKDNRGARRKVEPAKNLSQICFGGHHCANAGNR